MCCSQREQPLVVLILAPLQHLVDQWITEVEDFGVRPIAVYESSQKWLPLVEEQLGAARLGQRPVVAMVATNASFSGEKFQSILVADHAAAPGDRRRGTQSRLVDLPVVAARRTRPTGWRCRRHPERWFDDEGTDALIDYFGPIVFELGLGEAIEMGALSRYVYMPRLVELNDAETQLYVDLIGPDRHSASPPATTSRTPTRTHHLGFLLRQRAGRPRPRRRQTCRLLRADLTSRRESWFQLDLLRRGHPARRQPASRRTEPAAARSCTSSATNCTSSAHSYISETPRPERKVLLRRFGTGDDLRVLVAMRCLDEGVDIPGRPNGLPAGEQQQSAPVHPAPRTAAAPRRRQGARRDPRLPGRAARRDADQLRRRTRTAHP